MAPIFKKIVNILKLPILTGLLNCRKMNGIKLFMLLLLNKYISIPNKPQPNRTNISFLNDYINDCRCLYTYSRLIFDEDHEYVIKTW